jgi:hypothetical protein
MKCIKEIPVLIKRDSKAGIQKYRKGLMENMDVATGKDARNS